MTKYDVISYDVLGNDTNGYEVNDLTKIGEIELDASFDPFDSILAVIRKALNDADICIAMYETLEWVDADCCEITDSRNGKPLGRIMRKEE